MIEALVGAWCALTETERGDVEDIAPDVARLLDQITGAYDKGTAEAVPMVPLLWL